MNDLLLPELALLLLTCKRTEEAKRTVVSTMKNLQYPKELRHWYIADDGSPPEHLQEIVGLLSDNNESIIGFHKERMRHDGQTETYHAGLGWNKGLGICHQRTDFVLVLEDDWVLENPLDLVPYVKLLQNEKIIHEDGKEDVVGVVSFRILSKNADVHTIGYDGRMYLKYLRTTQYAFSGNPYLRHARFTKYYGWFDEMLNPGDMELQQDNQYRLAVADDAPQIWRPVDISIWGGWAHIGKDKSWK